MDINKNVKFVLWTDVDVYRLIVKYFPQYLSIYSSYFDKSIHSLKISDINRYFILMKFGGIYIDLDTQCQKPFDLVMQNQSCILSKEVEEQSRIASNYEYLAMNSLMACIPGHQFFKYVIQRLTVADNTNILKQTGPYMLTDLFISYSQSLGNCLESDKVVYLADSYTFSPYTESYIEELCNYFTFKTWKRQGCRDLKKHRELQKVKLNQSITVHLFMHLGYDDVKHSRLKQHICINVHNINSIWS